MKKQTLKEQREAEQKQVLKQRLSDMARGAYGGYNLSAFDADDFIGMAFELGLDAFARWVGAIQKVFGTDDLLLVGPTNLENFDSLNGAVEYLFNRGIRA